MFSYWQYFSDVRQKSDSSGHQLAPMKMLDGKQEA
jgi:hypothetical protein